MNRYFLEEIMKLHSEDNVSMIISFKILNQHAKVDLINDEDNNLYYSCNVKDIIDSNISNEELIEIRNGGWELNKEKNLLIKKL